MHEMETGVRHGYKDDLTRAQATSGVSQEIIDELSSLLMNLGKSLTVNKNNDRGGGLARFGGGREVF